MLSGSVVPGINDTGRLFAEGSSPGQAPGKDQGGQHYLSLSARGIALKTEEGLGIT